MIHCRLACVPCVVVVLIAGCRDNPSSGTPALAASGIETLEVAASATAPASAPPSEEPSPVGSVGTASAAESALPPLPVPPDSVSPMPTLAEFRKAEVVPIPHATALGCEASVLRDWVMVQCKEGPTTDQPVGAKVVRDEGASSRIRVSKVGEGLQVTMPLRKGVDAEVEVSWRTPGWGKRMLTARYGEKDERPVVAFDKPPPGPEESPLSLGQAPGEKPRAGRMLSVPAGARKGKEPVAAFLLDETEVTFHAWGACVEAGACPLPSGGLGCPKGVVGMSPLRPVNCVTWEEARGYCAWAGKRLPTEQEWWYAYHGSDGRTYPWGTPPGVERICDYQQHEWVETDGKSRLLNLGCKVGSHPLGKGPFGHEDLLSNVAEWTADDHEGKKVVLGGAFGSVSGVMDWREYWAGLMKTLRETYTPDTRMHEIGFRCARNAR